MDFELCSPKFEVTGNFSKRHFVFKLGMKLLVVVTSVEQHL